MEYMNITQPDADPTVKSKNKIQIKTVLINITNIFSKNQSDFKVKMSKTKTLAGKIIYRLKVPIIIERIYIFIKVLNEFENN